MKRSLGLLAGRRGFTLIELLVVISIIALLIGILLPALGAARSTARFMQSAANQRSLGQGMYVYATSSAGFTFPMWQYGVDGGWGFEAGNQIEAYWATRLIELGVIPTLQVYIDPSWEQAHIGFQDLSLNPSEALGQSNVGSSSFRAFNRIHYGYNYVYVGSNLGGAMRSEGGVGDSVTATKRFVGSRFNANIYAPASPDDLPSAADVMLTGANRNFNPNLADDDFSDVDIDGGEMVGSHTTLDSVNLGVGNSGWLDPRHNGGIQIMWADGHVSTLSIPGAVGDSSESDADLAYVGDTGRPGLVGDRNFASTISSGQRGGGGGSSGGDQPRNHMIFDLNPTNPEDF
ncbi:type II secretion system protein [Mucisphaera sp.]|uniref:type II secretion system protein n=1 Tax=Mucisphaera sp. TaxID=2913024 RepID=UPI003D0EAC86